MVRSAKHRFLCLLTLIIPFYLVVFGAQIHAAVRPGYAVKFCQYAVVLNGDGSADISDQIKIDLLSDLRDLSFRIDYADYGRIDFQGMTVNDPSVQRSGEDLVMEVSPADLTSNVISPMTYELKDDGQVLTVILHAFSTKGMQRTINIQYRFLSMVVRSTDSASITTHFADFPEPPAMEQYSVLFTLPGQVAPSELWHMGVSAALVETSRPAANQVLYSARNLKKGQSVKAVLIMPETLFPDLKINAAALPRMQLIAETGSQADRIKSKASLTSGLRAAVFLLLGLSTILLLLIFLLFDREGMARFRQRFCRDWQFPFTPAVLSILLRKSRPGALILSTLVDLVRRRELSLDGYVFTWLNPERNDYAGFKAYEIYLLQWLFGRISTGTTLSTVQIRQYARDRRTAEEYQAYYAQFRVLLDEELSDYGLFDRKKGYYGRMLGLILSLIYLLLAVVLSILLQSFLGFWLLLPSLAFFMYGLTLRHLTAEGNEQYARGKAFERHLRHLGRLAVGHENEPLLPEELIAIIPAAIAINRSRVFMNQLDYFEDDQVKPLLEPVFQVYQHQSLLSESLHEDLPALKDRLYRLNQELAAMEAMLSASLYLASGLHLFDDGI